MSNRLADTFARLRAARRPGLVTYTTAGDPDLPRSAEILKALDRAGADVLEVGVPFSDPLADGPVIQRATERALAAGGNLKTALEDHLGPMGLSIPTVIHGRNFRSRSVGTQEWSIVPFLLDSGELEVHVCLARSTNPERPRLTVAGNETIGF